MDERQHDELGLEYESLLWWFNVKYTIETQQYQRCQRMGEQYDKDIGALDAEAKEKQLRIRELRIQLGIS